MMNIGEVAKKSGLSRKAIRFYEQQRLITAPGRDSNGYRRYSPLHVRELTLLCRARQAGFSLAECQDLLRLLRDPARHSADVKARTLEKVAQIERQMQTLTDIRQQLVALAQRCPGDEHPRCPIIESLTSGSTQVKTE